jgi:UDP-N-acetylmuramate--alanine ligase
LAHHPALAPRAHMVGVAGAGMQALAQVLLERGWRISGTDANPPPAYWMRDWDVPLFVGHDDRQIAGDEQLVIFSDAIPADNVERRAASHRGLRQQSYAQVVGALMTECRGMAVAGTHGKSTTAAMIAQVMSGAGFDPTVIYGAAPLEGSNGGRAGDGEWMVAEACEYRANFCHLRPEIALVLGIEPDHFDYYATPLDLEAAFARFLGQVDRDGVIIANADCPVTRRVLTDTSVRLVAFGFSPDADWRPGRIEHALGRHRFDIQFQGQNFGRVTLRVAGRHQVANALAAAAACHAAGVGHDEIVDGLNQFAGLRRRLEHVATVAGIEVLDDYAHHPTEIHAALDATKLMYPGRRIWCIFQPHQVSRTAALLDEFAASLHNADRVAVTDVFVARENPAVAPRVMAENLAERVRVLGGTALPDCNAETILNKIAAAVRAGDVVITLGAGDIRKRCDELVNRIRTYRASE